MTEQELYEIEMRNVRGYAIKDDGTSQTLYFNNDIQTLLNEVNRLSNILYNKDSDESQDI